MESTNIIGWGTLAIAVYAALISTLNLWRDRQRDNVRILVEPCIAKTRQQRFRLAVTITNLSGFEVSISELGFSQGRFSKVRTAFHPTKVVGATLPKRLAPRTSTTMFVPIWADQNATYKGVRRVFARTACGTLAEGRNGALVRYINDLPPAALDEELEEALQDWGTIITSVHGFPKGILPGERPRANP